VHQAKNKNKNKNLSQESPEADCQNYSTERNHETRQRDKKAYTHTHTFLYVQEKHTPEKERRERERAKKPKITPKTLNHQIQMAPPKKNTCMSPAATGICPKYRAQKNTTPKKKKRGASGLGFPRICYQLVVDWERITGFQLIGGMGSRRREQKLG